MEKRIIANNNLLASYSRVAFAPTSLDITVMRVTMTLSTAHLSLDILRALPVARSDFQEDQKSRFMYAI